MTKSYDIDPASATWIDPTGQMEYKAAWNGAGEVWLSGTNLNDGTEWTSPRPVEEPERFGPLSTTGEFFAWVAAFIQSTS